MARITIDKSNFLAGVGIDDYAQTGGYSPSAKGHNLIKEKGVLYGMPIQVNLSGNLLDNVIATSRDRNIFGNDAYLLDASGNYYTLSGNTLTKRQTDGTNSYTFGTSDMVNFKGSVYGSSQGDVTLLTGSNLTTIDATWWSVTRAHSGLDSNYRHPLEVVEDTMYIGDKNAIHFWDGTTSQKNAMLLPTDQNITAMIKHTNGRNLIVFTSSTANYSNTKKTGAKMYIVDTLTLEFVNEIELEEQVNGAINVNGIIYVTYGQNLGYISGAGIKWLRDLNINYDGGQMGYKHHLGNLDNHLLVVEDNDVLAFGDLGQGSVFWYPISEADDIDFVINVTENKLLYGTSDGATPKLYRRDYDTASVLNKWRSNKYSFDSDVWIRRIDIVHTESNPLGRISFKLSSVDVEDTASAIKTVTYNNLAVTKTRVDCNIRTDFFELQLEGLEASVGFKKMVIHYENAE